MKERFLNSIIRMDDDVGGGRGGGSVDGGSLVKVGGERGRIL